MADWEDSKFKRTEIGLRELWTHVNQTRATHRMVIFQEQIIQTLNSNIPPSFRSMHFPRHSNQAILQKEFGSANKQWLKIELQHELLFLMISMIKNEE